MFGIEWPKEMLFVDRWLCWPIRPYSAIEKERKFSAVRRSILYVDRNKCTTRTTHQADEERKYASQEVQRKLYIMLNLSTPIYFVHEKSHDQSRWNKKTKTKKKKTPSI